MDAQKKFLDLGHLATSSALVGRLYTDCNKKIDEHGFAHPKVRHLSRAYKDSLDAKKHNLTISLPPELRNEIKDKKLRDMVKIAPETNDDIQNLTDNDDTEEDLIESSPATNDATNETQNFTDNSDSEGGDSDDDEDKSDLSDAKTSSDDESAGGEGGGEYFYYY